MEKIQREWFIFYQSFWEAINELPKENQLELYRAIADYSFTLKEPGLTGLSKTIWILIKPQIEANNRKYLNWKKSKRKQNWSKTEANNKQNWSKTEGKEKEKEKENEKENNNEIINYINNENNKNTYSYIILNCFKNLWYIPKESLEDFKKWLSKLIEINKIDSLDNFKEICFNFETYWKWNKKKIINFKSTFSNNPLLFSNKKKYEKK